MAMLMGRGDGSDGATSPMPPAAERHDLTIKARRRLLDALRKRDADEAVTAMTEHLEDLPPALSRPPAGAGRDGDELMTQAAVQ